MMKRGVTTGGCIRLLKQAPEAFPIHFVGGLEPW